MKKKHACKNMRFVPFKYAHIFCILFTLCEYSLRELPTLVSVSDRCERASGYVLSGAPL